MLRGWLCCWTGYLKYAEDVPGGAPRPGDYVEVRNLRSGEVFQEQAGVWSGGHVESIDENFDIWVRQVNAEGTSTLHVYDCTSFPMYRLTFIGYTCPLGWPSALSGRTLSKKFVKVSWFV